MNKYRIKFRNFQYNWLVMYAIFLVALYLICYAIAPQILYGATGLIASVVFMVVGYISSREITKKICNY